MVLTGPVPARLLPPPYHSSPKQRIQAEPLPVTERLIDNKAEHIIERTAADHIPADKLWGFKLDVPAHKYNRGELYNLEVARGTLSAEGRYQINDHMMQTLGLNPGSN